MPAETPDQPCPRCGARDACRVVYGLPIPEMAEAAQRGEVILGGCLIGEESPEFICGACGAALPWIADSEEDSSLEPEEDNHPPTRYKREALPPPTREEIARDPEALQRWWDSLEVEGTESEVQIQIGPKRVNSSARH